MEKERSQKKVGTLPVISYKRKYVINRSKGIYGNGFAVIIEGEIVMNWLIWHKGTHISPQDKAKVGIEWLRDLIEVLENELQTGE